jgi:hypothetical protein
VLRNDLRLQNLRKGSSRIAERYTVSSSTNGYMCEAPGHQDSTPLILCQFQPPPISTIYLHKIHINVILPYPSRLYKWTFPMSFPLQILFPFLVSPVLTTCLFHLSLLHFTTLTTCLYVRYTFCILKNISSVEQTMRIADRSMCHFTEMDCL